MKKFFSLSIFLLVLTSCSEELTFEDQSFEQKSSLPCTEDCPIVTVNVPVAQNIPVVADSINKKVFSVVKSILDFGETPSNDKDYPALLKTFIGAYDQMKREYPEDIFGWEGKINGKLVYESDKVLNIEIDHYTFTGGAHGYQGLRSLLFDPETGKSITYQQMFKDVPAFQAFAEKKFREKFKIPASDNINATGLMFEEDRFVLPLNIFYNDLGLLLYYNAYEAASYADGAKELQLTYAELEGYLAIK